MAKLSLYDQDYTPLYGTEVDTDEFEERFDKTPMELNVERPAMLFFLTRFACSSVEKEWDSIVRKVLQETYGEKDWVEKCHGLIYSRPVQRTIASPKESIIKMEFYILCRTFIKFLTVFSRLLHVPSEEQSLVEKEERLSMKDFKVGLRHSLRSLMDFRVRMMHSMTTISSREALAFVLGIRRMRQLLLPLRPPIVPPTTRLEKMREEVDPGIHLEEVIRHLKEMCKVDQLPFVIDLMKKPLWQVMRLFGFIILTMINHHLEDSIRYLIGDEETSDQVKALGNKCPWPYVIVCRDFVREHVPERKDFLDMRRGEPEGDDPTPRGRLRGLLKKYRTPKDPTRDMVDECAPQFNSAVTVLGSGVSLRSEVLYSREDEVKPMRVRNCTKACNYLVTSLTGDKNAFAAMKAKIERIEPDEFFTFDESKRPYEAKFWPQEYPILARCNRDANSQEGNHHLWLSPSSNAGSLIGRAGILKTVLQSIHDALGSSSIARVLLAGEPGIGKTSLAISTVFRLRKKCCQHFWLTAASRKLFLRSLAELGELFREEGTGERVVDDNVERARLWLQKTDKPFLFLVDDLQDFDLLDEFVPSDRHHVIITSSNQDVIDHARRTNIDVFTLEPLTCEESVRLIRTRNRMSRPEGKELFLSQPRLRTWLEVDLRNVPRSVENACMLLLDYDVEAAIKQYERCASFGNRFDDYEAESIK